MAAVRHLTEAEFATRMKVDEETAKKWRRSGIGPKYLPVTKSATKGTIRYREVDIEAWEESLLVDPAST